MALRKCGDCQRFVLRETETPLGMKSEGRGECLKGGVGDEIRDLYANWDVAKALRVAGKYEMAELMRDGACFKERRR